MDGVRRMGKGFREPRRNAYSVSALVGVTGARVGASERREDGNTGCGERMSRIMSVWKNEGASEFWRELTGANKWRATLGLREREQTASDDG